VSLDCAIYRVFYSVLFRRGGGSGHGIYRVTCASRTVYQYGSVTNYRVPSAFNKMIE